MSQHLVAALLALCPAADRPAKEPAYAGQPLYCRLAFGRDRAVVWLALDGDKLYADRNANGDLTDDEPAAANTDGSGDTAWRTFRVNELRVAGRTHRDLLLLVIGLKALGSDKPAVTELLARTPDAAGYRLALDVELPGRRGQGLGGRVPHIAGYADARGVLQFADRPEAAPRIHFDGPLTLATEETPRLVAGRPADLFLSLGTPGDGAGTFAAVGYEGVVPAGAYPVAEVTYPPKTPGDPPLRERYELKQRC